MTSSCSGSSSSSHMLVSESTQQGYERLVNDGSSSHSLNACRNMACCSSAALPTGPAASTVLDEISSLRPVRLSSCVHVRAV